MTKTDSKKILKEYLILTLGAVLMAVELYFFRFPNHFAFGGISGLSIELSHFFPQISSTVFVTVMDIFLLILGVIILGKSFGFRTMYTVVLMDLMMNIAQIFIPLDKPLTDEPILELIFAVGLSAISSALFFNLNASSGGTDIIAMIVKKYTRINIGSALLLTDALITAMTFLVFDVKTGLFSVLGLAIKSIMIDGMIANINRCKVFTIICSSPDNICSFITDTLDRSATVQKATGAYSGDDKYIVISIVKQRQAGALLDYLHNNCPDAFVTIANSSEVMGEGFRAML